LGEVGELYTEEENFPCKSKQGKVKDVGRGRGGRYCEEEWFSFSYCGERNGYYRPGYRRAKEKTHHAVRKGPMEWQMVGKGGNFRKKVKGGVGGEGSFHKWKKRGDKGF